MSSTLVTAYSFVHLNVQHSSNDYVHCNYNNTDKIVVLRNLIIKITDRELFASVHRYIRIFPHSNTITCRVSPAEKWREESSRLLFRYLFYWGARRDLDAPILYLQYTMYEMCSSESPSYEAHLCKRSHCRFPRLLTRQSNQTREKKKRKQ